MSKKVYGKEGSDNVFKDLGLPHPELEMLRTQLSVEIYATLKRRRLTQAKAAELLGVSQADVSRLKNADISRYSVDRLFRFLKRLGGKVEVHIRADGEERIIAA